MQTAISPTAPQFGPIVLRRNDGRLKQHDSFESALTEAERLVRISDGQLNNYFAVYVPVKALFLPERPVAQIGMDLPLEVLRSLSIGRGV